MPRCSQDEAGSRRTGRGALMLLDQQACASPSCARASRRARVSHRLRELGVGEDGGDDLAAVGRRVGVVGAHDALQLGEDARGFVGAAGDDAAARRRARRRARRTWRTSSTRNTGLMAWRRGARRRRRLPGPRRSPGRRGRGTASGRASWTISSTAGHCSWVRSTPVGLWQQACSTTIEPAGRLAQGAAHAGEVEAVGLRRRSTGSS